MAAGESCVIFWQKASPIYKYSLVYRNSFVLTTFKQPTTFFNFHLPILSKHKVQAKISIKIQESRSLLN